jgi:coenzyme Q-binding protein COQ10
MHALATIHMDAPADQVDHIWLDGDRWPEWYVGLGRPEEVVGDGGPGTRYRFTLTPKGSKPLHMASVIREHARGRDGSIHLLSEFTGDYVGWERWDYVPEGGGVSVTVELQSDPASGPFMKTVANLFFQRPFQRNTRQSLLNLKRLVEGM